MKIPGFEGAPFVIEEFVPKEIFNLYGPKSIWFINVGVVTSMVFLRNWFDASITINNWHLGGKFQNRAYRVPDSKTGAKFSQHKLAKAIDFNVTGLDSDEVSKRIIDNWADIHKNVSFTTIENPEFTKGWTHLDTRYTFSDKLLIVKP